MRRFETTADNKFWQFELTGNEALIEWGKIGGTGKQRQHKNFASEEVAKSEIAKLVAKKEKEGFVEVGKSAATAASPAPAKAAPTPTPKTAPTPKATPTPTPAPTQKATAAIEPRIVWSDELKSRAAGERDDTVLDLTGGKSVWLKELAAHFEEKVEGTNRKGAYKGVYKDRFVRGLSSTQATPTCRAWAERMLASYAVGKEPKDLDPAADGAVFGDAPFAPLASYLLTRGGVAYLAKVMLAAADVGRGWEGDDDSQYFAELPAGTVYRGNASHHLASVIHLHLASAPAKDRDEAQKVIESARATVRFPLRIVCARALGNTEWAKADAETYLASKGGDVSYDYVQQLFMVLRDPPLVTRLAKRYPGNVLPTLLIEDMGLDAEAAVIAHHDKDANSEWAAEALAAIESLPAAKQLAESLPKKRAAHVAKAYFERRPDLAVATLEPMVKNDSKLSPFAKPVVDAILRAHPELGSGGPAKPLAKVASAGEVPAALSKPPTLRKAVTLSDWQAALPQVLLTSGKALPDDAVTNLLLILHESSIGAPHAALAEVKRTCDAESLAAFAWALFETWLGVGGSSKEGWAFVALGQLGDDECARKLAPLVRSWPGESQHARAVTGLDVLGGIGSDVALMHLHGIAQKVKFKGLQEKARHKMDALAKARGLTAEELADRLVPDLGLDENGSMSLDFGSRTFTVGFDEELKPCVLDASGARLTDLPKPNKSDDAEKAKEATERFKALKKDARTIAAMQILRLEIAMCSQRRWTAGDFKSFIVDHPLVVHLARRLVWSTEKGTFRVAEDRTYVSADDANVVLPKTATVGLVHRLDMDPKTIASWGDHFGRYELLQPFDQLGRALFTIEDKEKKSASLERTKGMKVKTGKVLGLEVRGWRKGAAQDAGWVWDMNKTVSGFELTLPLGGGLCMGWHEGTPSEQELGAVGISNARGAANKATFGMLSPVVFSELVRELEMLKDG